MDTTTWTTTSAHPGRTDAAALLGAYYAEIVGRYHGRSARPDEVAAAMAEEPSDDLAPPTGLFLVAHADGRPAACVGLRHHPGWTELTRLFVAPTHRGRGGGAVLLAAAERAARAAGFDRIRLDTRTDLVEARALYARHGYREIAPYNDATYAQHWFEKPLT